MQPTASKLERVLKCLGSALLPSVDESGEAAKKGQAIHAFLARVASVGRDAALEEVPEQYRPLCQVIDLDVLPTSSVEVVAELALAYDTETGTARELGRNLGRNYPSLASTEFVGTADIVTITHDDVLVADFKTGHGHVTPAAENPQLRFLGLAASRVFRCQRLRVAIIRICEDGTPFFDYADYDAFDLDFIASELQELGKRLDAARDLLSIGEPPPLASGAHCRRCPSLPYCPGHNALVRKMVEQPDAVGEDIVKALTPESACVAWSRLKVAEEVVRRARESLYAYAREHPIPLPHGSVLGEVELERRVIDGKVAVDVLRRMYGTTVAEAAVEVDATQAGIERALRTVAESTGAKLAKLKREVMRELEGAGAISLRRTRSVREHRVDRDFSEKVAA